MIEFFTWLIGGFFSFLGFTYLYYNLVDAKFCLRFKFVVTYIFCVLSLALIYYYNISFLSVISYFMFTPILYYLIEYSNFKKFVFYILIIWIYAMILDLFAMGLASIVLHFYEFENYWYIFEVLMTVFLCLLLIVFAHNKRIKNFIKNLYSKILKVKYIDISLLFLAIFILVMSVIILLNLNHLSISMLLIILIFLIMIIFAMLIKYRVNAMENAIFIRTLKENNDFYIKMEDENRVFRHNLNAKLLGIKSVSNAKGRALLTELLKDNNQKVNFSNVIDNIPFGFNGIIYEKIYSYLKELNIKVENFIDEDIFQLLRPRRYNVLVEKMIIVLDNAIEACLHSNEKILIINLSIVSDEIIIEIKNTFTSVLDLDRLGNIGYSTKGNKRGLGLFSTLRNNEANLSIKIINNFFVGKIVAKRNINFED